MENFVTAANGYSQIEATPQLWTLSFEFQIYAVIPFAFMALKTFGLRRFIIGCIAIFVACTILRIASLAFTKDHITVWVLPFLRPDSILSGVILSIFLHRVPKFLAIIAFAGAGFLFFWLPQMETSGVGRVLVYPAAAILCASLVCMALVFRPVSGLLSDRIATFLGSISFGLYVFHFLGIIVARKSVELFITISPETDAAHYLVYAFVAFSFTVGLSTLSYYSLERPFLRLKDRLAVVHGRDPLPEVRESNLQSA
jgi:peptidoglycan/LPS O-acetylase OafA/YrhL